MQADFETIVKDSKITHAFTGFSMHSFSNKTKVKLSEGNCLVLQHGTEGQDLDFYIKMNTCDFLKKLNNSIFIKVWYEGSTSYLFFNQYKNDVVFSISMFNDNPFIITFQDTLKKNGTVYDYFSSELPYESKVRVDFHIDNVSHNEVIITFNKSSKVAKYIGNVVGAVSVKIQKAIKGTDEAYKEKLDRISRQSFSDQTKNKWQSVKEKAEGVNQQLGNLISPVIDKINAFGHGIEKSFRQSENPYIKSLSQFTKQTESALNQSYGKQMKQYEIERQEEPKAEVVLQQKQQKVEEANENTFYKMKDEIVDEKVSPRQ